MTTIWLLIGLAIGINMGYQAAMGCYHAAVCRHNRRMITILEHGRRPVSQSEERMSWEAVDDEMDDLTVIRAMIDIWKEP